MKNVYLIQAEITSGDNYEHFLPFSVGAIWANAMQNQELKNNYELKDIIWRRERQQDIIDRLVDPDIVGFSTYVWSHQWNITLAKKIKNKWPNCLIVFGGPSINEEWTKHEHIDVCMFGEGELAWPQMMLQHLHNEPIARYWNNPRIQDFSNIPSPYTMGLFDKIVEDNPKVLWFMMIETNRGCPYHCTYCGWGADYLNKLKVFDMSRVEEEINWAKTHNAHWIFIIDANSGILKERDVKIAEMIRDAIQSPGSNIRRITFNHAKTLNESCFEIERIIREWSYGMEIAVQSMHLPTLKAVKRDNMKMNDLGRAIALCRKYDIRHYTELVLGLPLETKASYIDGVMKLLEMNQHDSIKTYLATVIPNSEMDTKEYQERYGIELIRPKDLFRLPQERIWDEEDDSEETIAMVCATNTATRQDLADCLSFSWVMSIFHFAGYTQITSRYLHNMHGISYQIFYDEFYRALKNDELGAPIIDKVEYLLINYLTTGAMPSSDEWSNVVALTMVESFKYKFVQDNKHHFINLGIEVAKKLAPIHKDLHTIQTSFISDDSITYPFTIDVGIDIDRWKYIPTSYEVRKRYSVSEMMDQMYHKWLNKTDLINADPLVEEVIADEYKGKQIKTIPIVAV